MALSNLNIDDISESDLLDQIEAGVPEGILVDYKRDPYGRTDADVREFLKDISSFANTSGGHLIVGMDEASGIPTTISPLTGDADQELQRLENIARDGLEPRIAGLRMRAVPVGGGFVILVRVPRSWQPPHRVSARGSNRIYGRNSAGAYEYSVEELRVVFTASATALDRIRAFRAERLAKIDSGEAMVPLVQNCGRLVLHVVPVSAFGVGSQIDLARAFTVQEELRPMNSMGRNSRINFDGFCNSYSSDQGCWSYTQLFRNGAIEAVKVRVLTDLHDGDLYVPTLDFDKWIFEVLPSYLTALQKLDVPPPVVLMITLQGVRGARLGVGERWTTFEDRPIIDRAVLELPEILIESYGPSVDYQRAARPAFDALWNTGGYAQSKHSTRPVPEIRIINELTGSTRHRRDIRPISFLVISIDL